MGKRNYLLYICLIILAAAIYLRLQDLFNGEEAEVAIPIVDEAATTPENQPTSTVEIKATGTPEEIIPENEPSKSPIMVELMFPQTDELMRSPYVVKGKAHGSWFFEAFFPVVLTDLEGNILGMTNAVAVGDWMVDGMVNFKADLQFDAAGVDRGYLIFKKDNPSGLPENDAQVSYPVRLAF